jgi:mycothiol synthase
MNGVQLTTTHRLDADGLGQITRLADIAAAGDGYDSLSEHKRLELVHALRHSASGSAAASGSGSAEAPGDGTKDEPDEFAAVFARVPDHPDPVGYAQLNPGGTNGTLGLEMVIDPQFRDPSLGVADSLLDTALGEAARMRRDENRAGAGDGEGRTVRYWAAHATPQHDQLAAAHGLRKERDLIQMRRPLPIEDGRPKVVTRPFVPGKDEEDWLYVNNRAFATHPEQGNWNLSTLLEREAEPWFDPSGFLLYEQDGRLAASCWTKVHATTTPPMGEIYVISVDPDFQGQGLGRALTVAGLDSLANAGLRVGMLYVDSDNSALSLYQSMGFTEDHVDRAYIGSVAATGSAGSPHPS